MDRKTRNWALLWVAAEAGMFLLSSLIESQMLVSATGLCAGMVWVTCFKAGYGIRSVVPNAIVLGLSVALDDNFADGNRLAFGLVFVCFLGILSPLLYEEE